MSLTFAPLACSAYARFTAVVDLPTPPLQLATAMMCLTWFGLGFGLELGLGLGFGLGFGLGLGWG